MKEDWMKRCVWNFQRSAWHIVSLLSFAGASEVSEGWENGGGWPSCCQFLPGNKGIAEEGTGKQWGPVAPAHISFWEIRESPSLSCLSFPRKCGQKPRGVIGLWQRHSLPVSQFCWVGFFSSTECLCRYGPVYGKVQKDGALPFFPGLNQSLYTKVSKSWHYWYFGSYSSWFKGAVMCIVGCLDHPWPVHSRCQ